MKNRERDLQEEVVDVYVNVKEVSNTPDRGDYEMDDFDDWCAAMEEEGVLVYLGT